MWLLLQGWLLRNVLTLLRWLAAAAGVATVLFGARRAGRNAERIENMRRTAEVQRDQRKAASGRPRDRGELARRMRDGTFCWRSMSAGCRVQPGMPRPRGR